MTTGQNGYLLSWTTDFYDELAYSSFDRKSLKKLFSLFRSWGMRRVYWIYMNKYEEGMLDFSPCVGLSANAKRTYEQIGNYLPAATEIAHELGLEIYAIYKPFDLGFNVSFPFNAPEVDQYGKLDCLSGSMYWATDSLVKLQNKRLQRHPADVPDNLSKKIITRIKLTANQEDQAMFDRDDLKILVSDNNGAYKQYEGDYTFRHCLEKGNRVVYLENLYIKNPFLALQCDTPNKYGFFSNTLDKLIVMYDVDGNSIPFTYGNQREKANSSSSDHFAEEYECYSLDGYLFDHGLPVEGALHTLTHAIDNNDHNGITGLAKGKDRYMRGALSPAYPEVRECWLKHIKECIDAGVDGVDIRVANHNRTYEWERYGFEPPVVEEYKKQYGFDITKEKFSEPKHRKILGEFYTQFLKQATSLIQSHGKKAQVHICPIYMNNYKYNHYMNFNWEWREWLQNTGFDAVTIKDGPWYDESVWKPISQYTNPKSIPAYLCPYWQSVVNKTGWQKKFRQSLDNSINSGQAGLILYESSMVTRVVNGKEIELLYPEVPEILKDFQKQF